MRKISNEEFDRLKVYTEEKRIADEKDWEFLIKLNEESIEKMKKMPPEYFEEQNKYMEEYTKKYSKKTNIYSKIKLDITIPE